MASTALNDAINQLSHINLISLAMYAIFLGTFLHYCVTAHSEPLVLIGIYTPIYFGTVYIYRKQRIYPTIFCFNYVS